jgi:hypothetical protein
VSFASATQYVGLAFETTRGTPAAAPLWYFPFKPGTVKWTPAKVMLNDDGIRTSMVDVYQQVAGVEEDLLEFTTYLYVDSFPFLMRALLGSTDTLSTPTALVAGSNGVNTNTFLGAGVVNVTAASTGTYAAAGVIIVATGGTPATISYTGKTTGTFTGCTTLSGGGVMATGGAVTGQHTLSVLNNATATGNQPPSMTAWYFNGNNTRQMAYCVIDEIAIKLQADGLAEATIKMIGFPSVVASNPTYASTAVQAPPAWATTCQVVGAVLPNVVSADLSFKRGTKSVQTIDGNPGAYEVWAGPLSSLGGKAVITYEGDTQFGYGLANTQGNFILTVASAAGPGAHVFQHTLAGFANPILNPGKEWVELEMDVKPLPNATDATAGGVSQIQYQATNAVAVAY